MDLELKEALEGWLLDLRQRRRTDRTIGWYQETVGAYIEWLNQRSITHVSGLRAEQLRMYVLAVLGHLSAQTSRRRVGAIKTFSRWLEEQEWLPNDPYRKVRPPKADGTEWRILQPDDAKALLATYNLRKPDQFTDYVIVNLCLDTGLRRGEVVGAKFKDLNLEQQWLQVWGKGRKQRRVPLSHEVCSLLWKYREGVRKQRAARAAARGCDALFLSSWGTSLEPKRLSGRFKAHAKAAGITYRVRFHDLRHAAATWALKAGMPKERVSRMLGHANDAITSIYEHLDFEDIQAAHRDNNPLRFVS